MAERVNMFNAADSVAELTAAGEESYLRIVAHWLTQATVSGTEHSVGWLAV